MNALAVLKACGFTAIEIPLTKKKWTIIDIDDAPEVLQFRWHARNPADGLWYAQASPAHGKQIQLHRLVAKAHPGQIVDHENHNGLVNRRDNLRVCTQRNNREHSRFNSANRSGFKGVSFQKGRWVAQLYSNDKRIYLGRFVSPEEAARAYDNAAIEHHGQFAVTNRMLGKLSNG